MLPTTYWSQIRFFFALVDWTTGLKGADLSFSHWEGEGTIAILDRLSSTNRLISFLSLIWQLL